MTQQDQQDRLNLLKLLRSQAPAVVREIGLQNGLHHVSKGKAVTRQVPVSTRQGDCKAWLRTSCTSPPGSRRDYQDAQIGRVAKRFVALHNDSVPGVMRALTLATLFLGFGETDSAVRYLVHLTAEYLAITEANTP